MTNYLPIPVELSAAPDTQRSILIFLLNLTAGSPQLCNKANVIWESSLQAAACCFVVESCEMRMI